MGRLDCKIELGKLLAAEGKPAEAAEFLMKGAGIGDIAVFDWVQLFERIRKDFDRTAEELDAAEAAEDGDAAREALAPLREMDREFKDYPGLTTEAEEYFRRGGELSPVALVDHAAFLERRHAYDRWPEVTELLLRSHATGYDGARPSSWACSTRSAANSPRPSTGTPARRKRGTGARGGCSPTCAVGSAGSTRRRPGWRNSTPTTRPSPIGSPRSAHRDRPAPRRGRGTARAGSAPAAGTA
ncbi:hypothetical protein [Streptomyces sp. NPDC101150]|uniref:hypothetical protein n=1 Tax=Streptomyces sp. NPDC101150 TaxID=3366114 RepID=UPI0038309C52